MIVLKPLALFQMPIIDGRRYNRVLWHLNLVNGRPTKPGVFGRQHRDATDGLWLFIQDPGETLLLFKMEVEDLIVEA